MAKRVKIPGRLESAETGNIVTGADAVMDDAKGKTQVVINSEVDAAIIGLAQGKQDNLTFDNAPTEDSPNPVTSAGVYTADKVLSDAIEAILLLIPSAASALNKLVDMQTMNSSIATATASFKGTYNLVSDLHLGVDATHEQICAALDALSLDADNNDYAFVQVPNSATAPTEVRVTERYKFNGTNWLFEYDLNNSGFTQGQWNAINSGVTSLLVGKLSDLPTNAELTTLLAGKQDNLMFDNVPRAGSPNPVKSGGVYARNNEIVALINALDAAKQDVLTFDNAPVDGSPNPVKSGGVYTAISAVQEAIVALDAEKQNVLTFDSTPTLGSANPVTSSGIKTELNRIDGNVTTLNDLYEALTQSALVIVQPTDTWPVASPASKTIYRVVDRVNTPPQNYSDYMWNGTAMVLMATYDNAIDDEPTAGSDNLVKSGGVSEFLGSVIDGCIINACIESSTRKLKPQAGCFVTPFIEAEGNKKYNYVCGKLQPELGRYVCLVEYDENKNVLEWWSNTSPTVKTFTTKANTKYIRATFYAGEDTDGNYVYNVTDSFYVWKNPFNAIKLLNNNILEHYDDMDIIENHYLDNHGMFIKDNNYIVTPFIPVPDGLTSINWSSGFYADYPDNKEYLLFYDKDKKFISGDGDAYWSNSAELRSIPVKNNYTYIRFSVKKDYVTKSFLYNDKKAIIYSPTGLIEITRACLREGLVDNCYLSTFIENGNTIADRLVSDPNWMVSPFVEVSPEQHYLFWFAGVVYAAPDNIMFLGFFDKNKNAIADQCWSNGYDCTRASIPATAKYIRVSVPKTAHKDSYVIDSFGHLVYSYDCEANEPIIMDNGCFEGYRISPDTNRNSVENLAKDSNWVVSPFIAINPDHTGETYRYIINFGVGHGDVASKTTALFEFDENFNKVDHWGNGSSNRNIFLQSDTRYVRFGVYVGEGSDNTYFVDLTDNKVLWAYESGELNILDANPENVVKPFLEAAVRKEISVSSGLPGNVPNLVLLHYSDIHNDIVNLNRIIEFQKKYSSYLNDVLLTGDIAGGSWPDYSESGFNNSIYKGHLRIIGNHDVYNYNNSAIEAGKPYNDIDYWATEAEAYARYMEGIGNWGVTYQQDKCYWYKDYADQNIRLIGLDYMLWNNDQAEWLTNVLTSAKTAGKYVICTVHAPIQATAGKKDIITEMPGVKCAFNSITDIAAGGEDAYKTAHLKAMADAVQDFIDGGGNFVCWLCGHEHTDYCGVSTEYPDQIIIGISCAITSEYWSDITRVVREKSQDLFNIISFDTVTKTIRVFRIGANISRFMQKRESMCIDWENKECVYSS